MTGYAPFSTYSIGDPVEITGIGPGIINEIIGGPETWLYRVVLFGLDIDTGLPTSRVVRDVDMVPGEPLPPFEVGQIVRYIGRLGEVTVVYDENGGIVSVDTTPAKTVDVCALLAAGG